MAIETLKGELYEVHFDPESPFEGFQIRASSPVIDLDHAEAIGLAAWINDMVARASVNEPGTGSGWTT